MDTVGSFSIQNSELSQNLPTRIPPKLPISKPPNETVNQDRFETGSIEDFHTTEISPDVLPESTDVVIIGAGPAGLTLACELARRGINFLIFDINGKPVTQSRALMLHSRTLEIFADLGLTEPAVISGHIVRGIQAIVNEKLAADLKFTGIQGPFPFSLVLEQFQTERMLIGRLEELGHRVRRPVAVWKVELPESKDYGSLEEGSSDARNFSVLLGAHHAMAGQSYSGSSTPNGHRSESLLTPMSSGHQLSNLKIPSFMNEQYCIVYIKPLDFYGRPIDSTVEQIRCRYIVGCDGAKSSIRKAVDIDFESRGEPSEFLVADIAVQWGINLIPDRLQLIQNSNGVLICIPMPQNQWRIICTRKCPLDDGVSPEPFQSLQEPDFTELQQILETLVPGTLVEASFWTAAFSVNSRIAQTFRRSAGILCGDAAHCHPPMFCQGMNAGIQDAYNLGWKLAAVIRGAAPQLLDSYSNERKDVAEDMVRNSQRILDCLLRPGFASRCLFSTLGPLLGGIEFFAANFSRTFCQTDLQYRPSAIIGKNNLGRNAIIPGTRLPNASIVALSLVPDDLDSSETFRALVNYLRGGHHTIFLCVHVLPRGTKSRTIFGCERNEDAVRWSPQCLEKLIRTARLLSETLRGRQAEIVYGNLQVVWLLCGLVNVKSANNNIGLGQVRDHVPNRLLYFFFQKFRGAQKISVAVDYEDAVHTTLGLALADPDGLQAADKSGAFILVRPDGHVACNGYAGDSQATAFAFDYVVNWLSDSTD